MIELMKLIFFFVTAIALPYYQVTALRCNNDILDQAINMAYYTMLRQRCNAPAISHLVKVWGTNNLGGTIQTMVIEKTPDWRFGLMLQGITDEEGKEVFCEKELSGIEPCYVAVWKTSDELGEFATSLKLGLDCKEEDKADDLVALRRRRFEALQALQEGNRLQRKLFRSLLQKRSSQKD